jgi:hypothetical protein
MECRQPLFLPAASSTSPSLTGMSWEQQKQQRALGRYAVTNNNENAPCQQSFQQQPTVPLPIPKNLVLLSMMEAAERQSRTHILLPPSTPSSSHDTGDVVTADVAADNDERDDIDFDKIIIGMAALSGPCGTYAVRERNGLWVVPRDPRTNQTRSNSNSIVGIEVPDLCEGEPTTTTTASTKTSLLDESAVNVEAEEEDESSLCASSSSSSSNENENESSAACVAEDDGDSRGVVVAEVQMGRRAEESPDLNESSAALVALQQDENESIDNKEDEKEESFIIQSRLSLSFELAPRPKGLLPENQQHQEEEQQRQQKLTSVFLEYGQTVQVVSFYSGVAKLARDSGYIAASPRQLVKG